MQILKEFQYQKIIGLYLGEHAIYNFVNSMAKENKCCSDVMKKHFNKEFMMTKKDNEDFENSTECQNCDYNYVNGDVKVRDHCHITGKYRDSTHKYCNFETIKLLLYSKAKRTMIHILLCKNYTNSVLK